MFGTAVRGGWDEMPATVARSACLAIVVDKGWSGAWIGPRDRARENEKEWRRRATLCVVWAFVCVCDCVVLCCVVSRLVPRACGST